MVFYNIYILCDSYISIFLDYLLNTKINFISHIKEQEEIHGMISQKSHAFYPN